MWLASQPSGTSLPKGEHNRHSECGIALNPWFVLSETWVELVKGLGEGLSRPGKNAVNAAYNILNMMIDWVMKLSCGCGITFRGLIIDTFSFQLFTLPAFQRLNTAGSLSLANCLSPAKLGQKWSARWVVALRWQATIRL